MACAVEAEPEAVAPAEPAPAPPSKLLLRLVDPVSGEVISQLALDDPSEKSIDDSKQELGLDARSVVATRSDDGVLVPFEDGTISVQAAAEERGAKVVSAELKVCSLAALSSAQRPGIGVGGKKWVVDTAPWHWAARRLVV